MTIRLAVGTAGPDAGGKSAPARGAAGTRSAGVNDGSGAASGGPRRSRADAPGLADDERASGGGDWVGTAGGEASCVGVVLGSAVNQ